MMDSSGHVELLTNTSVRPQDVAGNFTLTGGTCEYYPPVDGKCAEPRNCADCLLKEGCAIDLNGLCTDANWTDPSLDYRKAKALGLVLPASNNSEVEQRWFFPAFTTSYCSVSDSICAQCRENKFWVSSDDVYNRHYDSRYCVGANGCVCVSVCEAGTWRVTNHEECLISNDDSGQLGAEEDGGRLATYAVVIISCLVVLVIGLCVYTFKPRRRQIPLTRLAEQHEGSHQTLQVEWEQSCVGKRSSTVETAAAYVSVEDASDDAIVAALKRTT